ncbi:thioredoxin family protein [Pontibacter liquoris]|uniref:thioredoxin family protein n=1 Tax=Pontibacter liquoris TaxID=2905677 RepID=UPI001FA6AF6A|nr:thioredoxin family protein [Pontibacter liquoris]
MAVIQATDTDFNDVLTGNQKVVVKYYADWCGSCRLFAPKFKRMSDDEAFTDVAFVDVNAENNPEARKLAGVTNLPFFAIFQHGKLVDTVAASKEDAVRTLIHKLEA